ncbi:MAG: DUF4255 domain-containing protein [Ferruginibacter sp.]
MALLDISFITRTYLELIRRGFVTSPAWTGAPPTILPLSPVSLGIEGIVFYLYHVVQKKEYDNFPIPSRDAKARFLPMALTLYYQLTANSLLDDENGPYNEQLMMSIAMKAIHDCPIIDDNTLTPNNLTPVLHPDLIGEENRLKISQQPVQYSEAVHNWTAGQAPMKLSAYYEVSTVFLEPDELMSYTGRVLQYGNYVFLKGAPRITVSQNIISYELPGDTIPREVKIQPAQAVIAKDPPAPVLQESIINFYGEGFDSANISLRLIQARWSEPVIASADWNITVSGTNHIMVTAREKAMLEKNNTVVDVLPGVYTAEVVASRLMQLPNGLSKEFKNSSNQFPFTLSPRIENISALAGTKLTVTGYIFRYIDAGVDILDGRIEVYTGENKMVRVDGAIVNQGEYKVMSATTMEINLHAPLTRGMQIPLRILINGAESKPLWINV